MNFFKKKKNIDKKVSDVDSGETLTGSLYDIVSGLKNALVRGESLDSAMQTFANAGYDVNDVMAAAQKVGVVESNQNEVKVEQNSIDSQQSQVISGGQQLPVNKVVDVKVKKKIFDLSGKIFGIKKSLALILGIVSLLFLIGALILGMNWEKFIG